MDGEIKGAGRGGVIPPVEHRFKPGRGGNPSGRPKGALGLTKLLKQALKKRNAGELVIQTLVRAIIEQALNGNDRLIREIWNRLDGKVPDRIVGADGEPVVTHVVFHRDDGTADSQPPPETT